MGESSYLLIGLLQVGQLKLYTLHDEQSVLIKTDYLDETEQ